MITLGGTSALRGDGNKLLGKPGCTPSMRTGRSTVAMLVSVRVLSCVCSLIYMCEGLDWISTTPLAEIRRLPCSPPAPTAVLQTSVPEFSKKTVAAVSRLVHVCTLGRTIEWSLLQAIGCVFAWPGRSSLLHFRRSLRVDGFDTMKNMIGC